MQKNFFLIAVGIIGAITFVPKSAIAQELPKLTQGKSYSEVREILIDAGWQALLISPMQREQSLSGTEKHLVEKLGYGELVSCAGTGLGLCRFEFAAADKRKLVVVTANNDPRLKGSILYRWWIEKPAKS
jgi:hypothetical protein